MARRYLVITMPTITVKLDVSESTGSFAWRVAADTGDDLLEWVDSAVGKGLGWNERRQKAPGIR